MDYHEILGVKKNASKEEIREAYEDKVNKFKNEIKDEKRAEKFIKLFEEAYIALNNNFCESNLDIIDLINEKKEDDTLLNHKIKKSIEDDIRYIDNNIVEVEVEKVVRKRGKAKSKNNIKSKKNIKNKKDDRNKKNLDYNRNKGKIKKKNYREINTIQKFALISLKIITLPIIVISSAVIFICKFISIASWIVSKAMIIAAIAATSIHGYQIYMGQPIQWNIFILCGIVAVGSFLLPNIVRITIGVLESINNILKKDW